MSITEESLQDDVRRIGHIPFLPALLDVVCTATGLGFAAVARVTDDRWIAGGVKDDIQFGLQAGGELPVRTTICHEILQSGKSVVIDHVSHDAYYCNHHTPATYGLESYISYPIVRRNGVVFGTVCAIGPEPAKLTTPLLDRLFKNLATLVAQYLDNEENLGRQRMGKVDMYAAYELKNLRADMEALQVNGVDERPERPMQLLRLKLDLLITMLEPDGAFVG